MFLSLTFCFYSVLFISSLIFLLYLKREILFKYQKYLTKDKTILLTGGCLGLGRELLHILITSFQCNVINLDIRESEFKAIKTQYKDKVKNISCNIAQVDDIIKFLKENNVNPDNIDIIINNAAIANNLLIKDLSKEQMVRAIEINLLSPMKIIKSFIDNKNNNKS